MYRRLMAPSLSIGVGRAAILVLLAALVCGGGLEAQSRAPARRPAPAPARKVEPAVIVCPQVLGDGVRTLRGYCDVQIGSDPATGIIVTIPPHTGPVTLLFDLHNRHTYSEDEIKANRAYHRYTATIGVLALDNTLISRAVVQNEFRSAADLVDRISGGSGSGGLKAVAPTGVESVAIEIPAEEDKVSILGEKLSIIRVDSPNPDTFTVSGRPIAIISNVRVEYRPGPARRPTTTRRR